MPWANGGGRTLEVARCWAGSGPFDWRVSIAKVSTSGAFTVLPGIDRVLVLLDVLVMTLTVAGREHQLVCGAPFVFDGGAATSCRVVRRRRGRSSSKPAVAPRRPRGATRSRRA